MCVDSIQVMTEMHIVVRNFRRDRVQVSRESMMKSVKCEGRGTPNPGFQSPRVDLFCVNSIRQLKCFRITASIKRDQTDEGSLAGRLCVRIASDARPEVVNLSLRTHNPFSLPAKRQRHR
jgi:hypothetical protein